MQLKTRAWIATGIAFSALLSWALIAFHNAFVENIREARKANNSKAASCPFSSPKGDQSVQSANSAQTPKKPCCHSKPQQEESKTMNTVIKKTEKIEEEELTPERISYLLENFGNLEDYTEEELKRCPHFKEYVEPILKKKKEQAEKQKKSK